MNVFSAPGFQSHGYTPIRPLPNGGWLVRNSVPQSVIFIAYPNKEPKIYKNYMDSISANDDIYLQKTDLQRNNLISLDVKLEQCLSHSDIFSGIFPPRDKRSKVLGMHLLPDNQEAFRTALNIPDDRYTLVISKIGGYFEKFDLPYQSTACTMPSNDGMTILVAQKDIFTVFDNPFI